MMDNVSRPKQIYFVPHPVIPVPDQVCYEQKRNPYQPMIRDRPDRKVFIDVDKDAVKAGGQKQVQKSFGNTDAKISDRTVEFEKMFFVFSNGRDVFQS